MAMARGAASAFGIATGGEAPYDTADAITHLMYPVGASQSAQNGDGYDWAQLATGFEEGLDYTALRYMTQVPFAGPAMDTTLPILASFALGGDTMSNLGSVSSAQHKIQPSAISSETPSMNGSSTAPPVPKAGSGVPLGRIWRTTMTCWSVDERLNAPATTMFPVGPIATACGCA